MRINNIDTSTLTYIFSIAKDRETNIWGVQVVEELASNAKKGVDVNLGPIDWKVNRTQTAQMTTTSLFTEEELAAKIARLQENDATDAAPYEKALAALQAYHAAPTGEEQQILRQTNTFDVEGNILTGRKAVLRTVETDAAGNEKQLVRAFTAANLARYIFQVRQRSGLFFSSGFYERALKKIGGKTSGQYVDELLKPYTYTQR